MAMTFQCPVVQLDSGTSVKTSVYFVKGPETDTTAGTWTGTITGLDAYYDGLTVLYLPAVAGASTTTLNINGLGAKTCYVQGDDKLTTHYELNSVIRLTYYNDSWRSSEYVGSNTKVTQNAATTSNAVLPVILAYSASTSKVTNAVNKSASFTYNPSTKALLTGGTVDGYAIASLKPLYISMAVNNSTLTSFTKTISNTNILAEHRGIGYSFVPSSGTVQWGSNISVSTSAGSATVTCTVRGTGTLYIFLARITSISG